MTMQQIIDNDNLILIENKLKHILAKPSKSKVLLESIKYSSLNAGKRIRPRFTIAAGRLSGADLNVVVTIGSAIELIHCFSLIHDDLPIMDNDDLRRGKPTNHKVYGDAIALLAGDALHALCFETLCSNEINLPAELKLSIISLIAQAIGLQGMVGGQSIDWLSTGRKLTIEQLQEMHYLKTGALIRSAVLSGFMAGDNYSKSQLDNLDIIAQKIGLLFQIVDDIIDATEDTATLGKTANKDLIHNKATYVNILGLNLAQKIANELHEETSELIRHYDNHEQLLYLTDCVYFRHS